MCGVVGHSEEQGTPYMGGQVTNSPPAKPAHLINLCLQHLPGLYRCRRLANAAAVFFIFFPLFSFLYSPHFNIHSLLYLITICIEDWQMLHSCAFRVDSGEVFVPLGIHLKLKFAFLVITIDKKLSTFQLLFFPIEHTEDSNSQGRGNIVYLSLAK